MEKVLLFLAFTFFASFAVQAQKVRKTADGNFVAVSSTRDSVPPTPTGKTYTNTKGEVSPVYMSKSGKPFVFATSKKTGKQYRRYLKVAE